MSQKRHQEDGKGRSEGTGSPEDKRRRLPTFHNAVLEMMKLNTVQHLLEPILEPLIRKVVKEEVELALRKHLTNMKQNCGKETHPSESRILKLQFLNNLSLPVFTGARIEGEECSTIQVALVDCFTGHVVKSGPESSAKVEIVVLEGDFDGDEGDNWTLEEFKNNIVREREGKKPLLTGDAVLNFKDGVGLVGEISFTDNSSWTRSRRFRLGARVLDKFDGTRIKEAKTESFIVRDHRGELYKKHHPPSLLDEVWRLEKIGKDGAFHKRLSRENINTVKDFLTLLFIDPSRLRNILGTGMSAKMWEVTVEHAQTCILDKRMYLYCPPSSQQRTGVVFNIVGQVMGLLLECEYIPISKLSEAQKADGQKLVISAFEHWEEVIPFDDEASLRGASSNSTSALHTSTSPRADDPDGSKFLASQKVGGFDYPHPSVSSPDIISSIYSVGSTSGLDDYALHNIDGLGLRYDQTLSFPASPIGGGKPGMNGEVEKGLLTLISSDSPGIQVCDPNGRWYLAEVGLAAPGDVLLLTGKALSHATAGLRPAASYKAASDYSSGINNGGRISLAFRLMPQGNAILDCSPIAAAGHVIPQSYVPISVSQFMDDLSVEEDVLGSRSDSTYVARNNSKKNDEESVYKRLKIQKTNSQIWNDIDFWVCSFNGC